MPAGHGHQKVNTVTRNELNLTQNMCLPVQQHLRKLCLYFPIFNFFIVCLLENNIWNSITCTAILQRAPASFLKQLMEKTKWGLSRKKTKMLLVQETDCRGWLSLLPLSRLTYLTILSCAYLTSNWSCTEGSSQPSVVTAAGSHRNKARRCPGWRVPPQPQNDWYLWKDKQKSKLYVDTVT